MQLPSKASFKTQLHGPRQQIRAFITIDIYMSLISTEGKVLDRFFFSFPQPPFFLILSGWLSAFVSVGLPRSLITQAPGVPLTSTVPGQQGQELASTLSPATFSQCLLVYSSTEQRW